MALDGKGRRQSQESRGVWQSPPLPPAGVGATGGGIAFLYWQVAQASPQTSLQDADYPFLSSGKSLAYLLSEEGGDQAVSAIPFSWFQSTYTQREVLLSNFIKLKAPSTVGCTIILLITKK